MTTVVPAVPASVEDMVKQLNVSRESWQRVQRFVDLLFHWQARINLVSPASLPDVWMRHVVDSLQLLPLIPPDVKQVSDLGSGSGFPGLPIAIASGLHVDLHESNAKKSAFLREALRVTEAKGAVHLERLGTPQSLKHQPPAQLVTGRALAPLSELLELAEPFLQKGATALFHKGQDVDAELTAASKSWKIKAQKHPSLTDSRAVILEVKEVSRV